MVNSLKKYICFSLCSAVLIAACQAEESQQFRSDYTYDPAAKGWFKINRVPAKWHEARLRCNLEGTVLASPLDASLRDAMMKAMADHELSAVFSGISATFSNGDYFSVEGVPIFKMPISWVPGEPDNYEESENCLMLHVNGTMADVKCSVIFPYICYKKDSLLSRKLITGCGTLDREYKYEASTGSCYKFHRIATSWARAYMTCAAEGGYLSIINSDVESRVLKDIFAQNPEHTIVSTDFKEDAFIGFLDWGDRTWRTIHGETLENAGFDRWSEDHPNKVIRNGKGKNCGSFDRSGRLNDMWCNEVWSAFICEKDPGSFIINL